MSCGRAVAAISALSCHGAEQLRFQDELAFLVLLAGLVSFIILPAYGLLALSTVDVAYDVATGGHVALVRLRLGDVDNAIKQICFTMLTAEVLVMVSR